MTGAAVKILLEAPTFSIQQRDGTALISVPVRADESSTISAFEKALQDEHHVVKGNDPAMLPQANDGYNWRVVESINITGRGWDVFASKPTVKSNTEAAEPSLKVTAKPDEQTPPTPAETSEPTGQLPGIETDVPLADPPSVESGADANSTVSPTTEVPAATESSAEPSEGEIIPNRETVAAPVSGGDTDEHDNDGEPETTTV